MKTVAAPMAASGQFDETTTITAPKVTIKMVKSFTFKSDQYRVDTESIDLVPYSRIIDKGTVYSYLPNDQMAMRQVIDDKGVTLQAVLLDQKTRFLAGTTKSGKETISGFLCDIYTAPPKENGNLTGRVWVSEDPKFPFVIKTETVHHKEGVTNIDEISNVRLNTRIAETAFVLPKNTKVQDASTGDQASGGAAPAGQAPAGQGAATQPSPAGDGAAPTANPPAAH